MVESGDIGLVINVIALFLLLIGVMRRGGSTAVLIRHGYLSILGFALKMATVVILMIPTLAMEPLDMGELSPISFWILTAKIATGIAGTILGFVCIVPWFTKPLSHMACSKVRRWMLPTTIVWTISVILGAIVHLGKII